MARKLTSREKCATAQDCEIASNIDPGLISSISLIAWMNPAFGWGHDWTRKMTPSISIFSNGINLLEDVGGGVIVGRNFTTLMVPTELKARLEAEVEEGVRTFSDVAREALRRGLEAEPSDVLLSPKARLIGRLIARLASDLVAYSRPEDTAAMLKIGGGRLLDRLGENVKLKQEAQKQAEDFADFLWLKMMNAHQATTNEGNREPQSVEQGELLEIRSAWFSSVKKPTMATRGE